MSGNNNPSGVTGSDDVTPIRNSNNRFQIYSMAERYVPGGPGNKRYVPNPGDLVFDTELGLKYRCVSVNEATLESILVPWNEIKDDGSFDDLLLGPGPGTQSDTYVIKYDTSVIPYSLTPDERLSTQGSMSRYYRVFRGSDYTNQGDIISHLYDSQGNIVGDMIPMSIAQDLPGNRTVRVCDPGYTMDDLDDNELVTIIIYSDTGGEVSKRQMRVEKTAFTRQANIGEKYVMEISLKSPFLSPNDSELLEVPMNVIVNSMNLKGVVHFSDGTSREDPVDGTRFTMQGLNNYVATKVDQRIPLVLRYIPPQGEVVYGLSGLGEVPHKSKQFSLLTKQQDGTYNLNLYCYPVWIDAVHGYTLRWMLYNGDRNINYDVTGLVEFQTNSPAFQPTAYGVSQPLSVAVNLQAVNGSYKDYRHVQTVDIILRGPGTDRQTNWTIAFNPGQNPRYGVDVHADVEFINVNLYKLKLDMGLTTQADWLKKLYYDAKPVIDQTTESEPPLPTHYRVKVGAQTYEFALNQWNQEAIVGNGLVNSGTVFVEFVKRTPNTDMYLSVAGLPVYMTGI